MEVTRTQGVPTEDDEEVSVSLTVVQKKEVPEDKSDLKLGGIEPSTTRFDGESSVEAPDEVAEDKTDLKLGLIEPLSIRIDGEPTLDCTATRKEVTRTQGEPTEDDEQVSVSLTVVQKKEVSLLHLADITEKGVTFQSPVDGKPMLLTPKESIQIQVLEDKSDLKLGGIEPSTTRFDGEPSVEAADEVAEDRTDMKLGVIEPLSIRIDGETTLDCTATKKTRKVAENKPKQVSDAKHVAMKQSCRTEAGPQRGAAHPLNDAANQLTVAGFQLKSRDSFTGVGFALRAAGHFFIDAGLEATGHALIAAGLSLMTVPEAATPAEGSLQIAGRGTNEIVENSAQKLPGTNEAAPIEGPLQIAGQGNNEHSSTQDITEPDFSYFPLPLSSSDGTSGASADASTDGDASRSDGSHGEEPDSESQSPDVIVGGPKVSYLKSIFEQQ